MMLFISQQNIYSQNTGTDTVSLAGFRASRVNSSYPGNQFPNDNYWVGVGKGMSGKFSNAVPSSIWIVSLYDIDGKTRLGFPYKSETNPQIVGSDFDMNESYLERFDREGFKIFLQVEPGSADVDTLMDIVLKRYGHHSCVIGFGVDIEWYQADKFINGNKVTDETARQWEVHLKNYNKDYILFLKHFWPEWMPPKYRGNIVFIDDGQEFKSLADMKNNFKAWADSFPGSKVGFQYGYPTDENWWLYLNDPAKTIGDTLLVSIPNIAGLYWVDFSVTKIFPMNTTGIGNNFNAPNGFNLAQNYPNPFNPSTTIEFQIDSPGFVNLTIYDALGRKIRVLVNEERSAGKYSVIFDASDLASGMYFYRLSDSGKLMIKKMILLK